VSLVAVVPALDEEEAIGSVVAGVSPCVDEVVVVDNGSSDGTARAAEAAGARVVREPRRGYGAACLAGALAAPEGSVLVVLDGDGSFDPSDVPQVAGPVSRGEADLVVGSRMRLREPGAMPLHAALANRLFTLLLRALHGRRFSDLGPMRAVRREALLGLGTRDRSYGWNAESQVRAVRRGLRIAEVDVAYRRRVGRSKVSGSPLGSARAALRIARAILWGWR
jgi:glycosyltransferase involved in cell wall biosynthesis